MFNDKQRERLERARSEPMDHWIESEDPLVVKVENEQSGSVHTVIPDALDCSCPDSTYRDFIDKHMLYLCEQDDEAGTAMRGALKSHQEELKKRYGKIQSEVIELQGEIGLVRKIMGLISVEDEANDGRDEAMQSMTNDAFNTQS